MVMAVAWRTLMIEVGALAAFFTALGVLSRVPAIRWIVSKILGRGWHAVVVEPAVALFKRSSAEVAQAAVGPQIEALRGELAAVQTEMAAMSCHLAAVAKQVTPNGGNTDQLGDRMLRVEQELEGSRDDRTQIIDALHLLNTRLTAHDGAFDALTNLTAAFMHPHPPIHMEALDGGEARTDAG